MPIEELVDMLMTIVLYCVGNASYDPGSTYDAHARPATLHAPSWHDASSGDGAWSDSTWCHTSRPDDAWTDAWSNAPAGLTDHIVMSSTENNVISSRLFFSDPC